MLSKTNRIPRSLFKDALLGSRFLASPFFTLRYKTTTKPEKRFSFVVSKEVSKKAVERNLIRRRGYSIINTNLKNIKSGINCAFRTKKGVIKLSFKELEGEVVGLLKKAGVI